MTPQTSSLLAIVGGALLGAVAALVGPGGGGSAPPPGDHEPFRPVATRSRMVTAPSAVASAARSPAAPSAAPSALAPVASSSSPRPGLPEWEREPLQDSPESRRSTELSCARGNAMDCMRVGVAYYYGRGMAPKEKEGKLFLGRARKLLVVSCEKRNPTSCLALAHIHTEGIGVPKNPTNAAALLDLARTFCKVNPAPACDEL
jgi:hypothetical protein